MEITELDKRLVHIAILELWEKFMPEKTYELDGVERLNLEMYKDNFYVLTQWLKNDVIYLVSLAHSEKEKTRCSFGRNQFLDKGAIRN